MNAFAVGPMDPPHTDMASASDPAPSLSDLEEAFADLGASAAFTEAEDQGTSVLNYENLLLGGSPLHSQSFADTLWDIPSVPVVPTDGDEPSNRKAKTTRGTKSAAARAPRKREVKKKQPQRCTFNSDLDFEQAHLAWKLARAKNNESVKRSREKARDRYNHSKKRLRSVDEARNVLMSEAVFLERCVGIMVKALMSRVLLTDAEQDWLSTHLGHGQISPAYTLAVPCDR